MGMCPCVHVIAYVCMCKCVCVCVCCGNSVVICFWAEYPCIETCRPTAVLGCLLVCLVNALQKEQ